jgi:hypothetical protein
MIHIINVAKSAMRPVPGVSPPLDGDCKGMIVVGGAKRKPPYTNLRGNQTGRCWVSLDLSATANHGDSFRTRFLHENFTAISTDPNRCAILDFCTGGAVA